VVLTGMQMPLGGALLAARRRKESGAVLRLCEHEFVSLSALHHALRDKDAERSLEVARSLRHVPLRYAMRITLLLAEKNHPLYEAAARRVLVRVIVELEPPMIEAKKLADVLAHVHSNLYWYEAQLALRDVVGQLHRMARSLSTDVDSLAIRKESGGQSADPPRTEDDFLADLRAALPNAPARWLDGDRPLRA
jgi:hypothetical protein